MKYAYFISCVNEGMSPEADEAIDKWSKDLGIEFEKLHEGTCCGGSNVDFVSPDHFLAINGRNIALAEKMGLDLVTSCNTCLLGLREAKLKLDADENKRKKINELLAEEGLEYTGKSEVKHLLWVLNEDIGLEKLSSLVKNPLSDYKFAPFYGCHILRPSHVFGKDDPNAPSSLDELIKALGGKVVPYESNNKCCGFHTLLVAEKESLKLSGAALSEAIDEKADYIVTPCPLCHTALDGYQSPALKEVGSKGKVPVLHLQQMIGMALGYSPKEMGVQKHMVR